MILDARVCARMKGLRLGDVPLQRDCVRTVSLHARTHVSSGYCLAELHQIASTLTYLRTPLVFNRLPDIFIYIKNVF